MTQVVETLLQQLVHQPSTSRAIGMIVAMTGCQIVHDEGAVSLYFKRQVGNKKITHLRVAYNEGTDLYNLKGYKLNKRSGACPEVWGLSGVYAEDLKRICEDVTGLYFSL